MHAKDTYQAHIENIAFDFGWEAYSLADAKKELAKYYNKKALAKYANVIEKAWKAGKKGWSDAPLKINKQTQKKILNQTEKMAADGFPWETVVNELWHTLGAENYAGILNVITNDAFEKGHSRSSGLRKDKDRYTDEAYFLHLERLVQWHYHVVMQVNRKKPTRDSELWLDWLPKAMVDFPDDIESAETAVENAVLIERAAGYDPADPFWE